MPENYLVTTVPALRNFCFFPGLPAVLVCMLFGFLALGGRVCIICEHSAAKWHMHLPLRSGEATDNIRFQCFPDLPIFGKLVPRHAVSLGEDCVLGRVVLPSLSQSMVSTSQTLGFVRAS